MSREILTKKCWNNFAYNVKVAVMLFAFSAFCLIVLAGFCILIVESLKAGI